MPQKLPFWAVRKALFARLKDDPATAPHTLRRDGEAADYPFIALGVMTYADEATDTSHGGEVLAQVDAWALVEEAGGRDVNVMASGVVEAASREALVLPDWPSEGAGVEAEYLGLETAIMQEDYDSRAEQALYHVPLRLRFHVLQGGPDLSQYAPPPGA